METFLALYDRRGQCQYVAVATTTADLQAYLEAGFVEVDESEYNRCAALTRRIRITDLPLILAAADVLRQILTRPRSQPPQVDPDQQRRILRQIQGRLDSEFQAITDEFLAENLTAEQWQRRMMDTVNSGNIAVRQVAVGGAGNLSQGDIRAIERANETQAQYLNRFRRDLEAGQLSEAQARARARLYASSGTPLFEEGRSAAMGLPTLPAYPALRTDCTIRCRCHWSFGRLPGRGNWNCYWILGDADHCDTCIAREAAFDPLRIRNGIIQPFNPSGIYA